MTSRKDALKPGKTYQHYKGGVYKILSLARHSETMEILVVYQSQQDECLKWARPLDMFLDSVEKETYSGYRFTEIKESETCNQR